jgi:hypothetical protein
MKLRVDNRKNFEWDEKQPPRLAEEPAVEKRKPGPILNIERKTRYTA